MNILNLDKSFEPFGKGLPFERFEFPSGNEPHIKITEFSEHIKSVLITIRIKNGNDILLLLLATDSLKRIGVKNISLFISYLPFARQDRVMVKGEPLSIKVIADLINAQNYDNVQIYDPHSEVSLALINNSIGITNHSFVKKVLMDKTGYFIVSPDAGAYKKVFKLAQSVQYKHEIILCNKVRNTENGKIENVSCPIEDFQGFDLFIIDDICDGGGTFVLLANELKKRRCGKINLIISHGIFSKGIESLSNIDHIYTTNSFSDLPLYSKLTQIKLNNGLLS